MSDVSNIENQTNIDINITSSKPSVKVSNYEVDHGNWLFDEIILNSTIENPTDGINEVALFDVGDIVDVAPRTWIGINKPGGRAKVKRCNEGNR